MLPEPTENTVPGKTLPEGKALARAGRDVADGEEEIRVVGARVHNLKNISFTIPHNEITVVTGVSGFVGGHLAVARSQLT